MKVTDSAHPMIYSRAGGSIGWVVMYRCPSAACGQWLFLHYKALHAGSFSMQYIAAFNIQAKHNLACIHRVSYNSDV